MNKQENNWKFLFWDNTSENSGILIGGFKAIDKSALAKNYNNVIDLESSNFEYIIDENIKNIPGEQRKRFVKEVYYADFPKDLNKVILL